MLSEVETGTEPDALEDLFPEANDGLWHRVRKNADLMSVVHGVPILTLCGCRMPRPAGVVWKKPGDGKVRQHCRRCDLIYQSLRP